MTSVTKEYLCIICTIFICTNGWCRFDCKYLFNHTGTNYIWKFEIYNLRRTCLYAKRINITVMVSLLHRQVLQNKLWNISCLILLHHKIELNLESVCLKPVQMCKKTSAFNLPPIWLSVCSSSSLCPAYSIFNACRRWLKGNNRNISIMSCLMDCIILGTMSFLTLDIHISSA